MPEVIFPPYKDFPSDFGLSHTVAIKAHYAVAFDGMIAVSIHEEGDEVPTREYNKLVVVEFDTPIDPISATYRKNWQLADKDTGNVIIPESVSLISEMSVALSVPTIQYSSEYDGSYSVYDTEGAKTTGTFEVKGI